MAEVRCFTRFLLFWFAALSPAVESGLTQVPEDHRPAGVFLLTEGGNYTFDFSTAKDVCQSQGVTLATKEQVQRALKEGLETCKYGWVAEAVAVVPRLTPDMKCGKNQTGLVEWAATTDTKFGVFCFSVADSMKTLHTPTAAPRAPPMTNSTAPTTPAKSSGHFLNSFTSCFILLTSVLSLFHAHFL